MKALESLLERISAPRLLAAASASAALGVVFMALPSFVSSPLFVIAGMSLGHVFGLLGVLLFAASVVREVLSGSAPDVSPTSDRRPAEKS